MSDALFDEPWYRVCEPREVKRWVNWAGPKTTCDDCALLIGTGEATFPASPAVWGLQRTNGTVGAYCGPHALDRVWKAPK